MQPAAAPAYHGVASGSGVAPGTVISLNDFRKLDASVEASGPHDFAVRVSAARQERCRVHRIPSQRP
jgi:hypothetical protein